MFYNAKNNTFDDWNEQTGVAVSTDMLNWERFESNPVLEVSIGKWDSLFVSDPFYEWAA